MMKMKGEYELREDEIKKQYEKRIETNMKDQMEWTEEIQTEFSNMVQ